MRQGRGIVIATVFAVVVAGALLLPASAAAIGPTWQPLTNSPPFNPGAMYLLTDGTVMVQDLGASSAGSPNWWKLTPDGTGSYVDGTWSQLASLPSYYGPGAYAAAVLPDGRLAIDGGEYNNAVEVWTNLCAIYDPVANAWTMIPPQNGGAGSWFQNGDAPSVVLADGRWLVGGSGSWTTGDAILDPTTLTWTTTGGPGKTIGNAEAGFTLLPSGRVLTVDALPPACTTRAAEVLDPATLTWSSAGSTPAPLVTCDAQEIGPQMLLHDGKVFVEGGTAATALYDVATGTWSAGPDFPVVGGQQAIAPDSGSALLPDGDVLLATRTGAVWPQRPTHFFLFDGTSFTQAPEYATSDQGGSLYMLLLPTGQVLYNGWPAGLQVLTDPGSPDPAWAPSVTSVPTTLAAGGTYTLDGDQLNGLSEGAAFGDDYQSSTDYPLVQITDTATGTVTYARTSAMANRSIAPGAFSCTNFTLPAGIPQGAGELRVVADGIESAPVAVTVGSTGANTTTCVPTFAAPPVVSGVPGVSHVLTSTPATWGNATTYAYQWQRCAADGTGCSDIAGATGATYLLGAADAGHTLRSTVKASNGNSSVAAAMPSSTTAVIVPLPASTGLPVLSGSPIVGKTIATTAGAWNTPVSVAYQWLRCGESGCTPIDGAVSSTRVLTFADSGEKLEAQVSATNLAGVGTVESDRTAVVVGLPADAVKPHVFGRPRVGRWLRASHGSWTGRPATYAYQWLRCSRKGAKCIAIRRAVGARYRPTLRDAGHRLRVRVVAANAAGSAVTSSSATRVVATRRQRSKRH